MPPIKSKKKKFKTNDRIEAALKEINSFRPSSAKKSTKESAVDIPKIIPKRTKEGPQRESNNDIIGTNKNKQFEMKSTAEKLEDLNFLLDTLQITKEKYDQQKINILAAHHRDGEDSQPEPDQKLPVEATGSDDNIANDEDVSKSQQEYVLSSPQFDKNKHIFGVSEVVEEHPSPSPGSGIMAVPNDRSSSSPTQESDQGSVEPMGLFSEDGVYHTSNTGKNSKVEVKCANTVTASTIGTPVLPDHDDDDNMSDDHSETGLHDHINDENDSLSSCSNDSEDSDSWEILAMQNKQKNKEILRELYLDVIEGRPITPAQSPSKVSSGSDSPPHPGSPVSVLKSPNRLIRNSSSVNFSEHDGVQEYEKDSKFNVIPISMDPTEIDIVSFDSEDSSVVSPLPAAKGKKAVTLRRNPSFIIPEYNRPSKMSLEKTKKGKGGFFAAMKKKKAEAAAKKAAEEAAKATSTSSGGCDVTAQGDSDVKVVSHEPNSGTTLEAKSESSSLSSSPFNSMSNLTVPGEDVVVASKQCDEVSPANTVDKVNTLVNDVDEVKHAATPEPAKERIDSTREETISDQNDEIAAARAKLTKLLLESPEFRASVMSFPDTSGQGSLNQRQDIRLDNGEPGSVPKYKLDQADIHQNSVEPIVKMEVPPTTPIPPIADQNKIDPRITKWNDRLGLDQPAVSKKKVSQVHSSPPRRGSLIENSNNDDDDDLCTESSSIPPETRSTAMRRLTQPRHFTSPSVELAKPPPVSGTTLLDLPTQETRLLVEKCREEKSFVIHLEPCEEKLRIKLKATEDPFDWEYSNKFAYYGLNFNRSEFMEFENDIVPYRPSNTTQTNEVETQENGRVRPDRFARGLAPTNPADQKKKLLISHEEAFDFLYINRLKLLRKVRPHLAQMDTFCHKYFVSFICLVFDLKMQLLGTYDHKLGKYFPGVAVCPPHVQKQKRRRDNHRYANLLEVDFNKLPVDTFAVVPVVCDVSPRSAEFPGVHLQLDVAVNNIEQNIRRLFDSGIDDEFKDSETVESSLQEQFDVESEWVGADEAERKQSQVPDPNVLPAHVDANFLDLNWTHVESFFVERTSTLPKHLGEGPKYNIDQNQTRSQTVGLAKRSSYIPFILFRRLDHADKGTASGERLWSIKGVQKTFEGILPHVVARNALDVMKEAFVVPIHHINVEHCINCDKHKSTTWHVPGSYEKRFEDLQGAIQMALPPCIVTSNKFTSDTAHIPRIGSFDITIRPFFSNITQLLHSKVISKQFPTPDKIVNDLATLLLPEQVTFTGVHTLELHVYDGYDRIPLKGATVKLYRVEVNPSIKRDLKEVVEDFKKKQHKVEEKVVSLKPCAANNWLMPIRNVEKEPSEDKEPNKGMPQIPRDSIAYKKKRERGKGFTTIMTESKSLTAARMRHSKSFFNVRTWRKEEVAAWLKSYGLQDEVVQAATFDGAVDGPSFLSIVSTEALQRWGVKSRLKLTQMQKSLDELKQDHSGNVVTSYDPYTYNELLEGAADRYTATPLHSEPAKPRESKHMQDITYHPVGNKKTGPRGLCFMNVDVLGSYMLRIESPQCTSYCSHVFQVNGSGHSAFCASLNPTIGLAKFRVQLEMGINEENFEGVDESGILVSMVNLHNGKRHIAVVKFDHPTKTDVKDDECSENSKSLGSRKHLTSGNIVSTKKKIQGHDGPPSSKIRKPLHKESTAGSLLMKGLISRNTPQSAGGGSRGSILQRNTSENSMKMATAKVTRCYCTAEIWLPAGKYYSEVDGAVFVVKPMIDNECSDDSWNNVSPEFFNNDSKNFTRSSPDVDYFDYTEEQTRKCHRRIVMSSVRAFQKIYRRYKKNFLRDNIWAYLTLKRIFRRVLKRIRHTIAVRRAAQIQSVIRMQRQRRAYKHEQKKIQLCNKVMRRYVAKVHMRRVFGSTELIRAFVRRWLRRRRIRRNAAAVVIQLMARRMFARKVYFTKLFERRLSKRAKRYVAYIRKRIINRKFLAAEQAREEAERSLMDAEHEFIVTLAYRREQYEKDALHRKLKQMQDRLERNATVIQKVARGFGSRLKLSLARKAVIVLQKRHRLYLFGEQIKKKPQHLSTRQKFVAYCPGFPSLKNNPQLLGATRLLQGMYDQKAHEAWLVKKNAPPEVDEGSLTASQHRIARKMSFVETILHRVLDIPATKITSIMLMNRDRTRYVKHWQDSYSTEEYPPLFRRLLLEVDYEEEEGDEDDNEVEIDEDGNSNDADIELIRDHNLALHSTPEVPETKTKFGSFLPTFSRKEKKFEHPVPEVNTSSNMDMNGEKPELKNKKKKQTKKNTASPATSPSNSGHPSKKKPSHRNRAAIVIQKYARGYILRSQLQQRLRSEPAVLNDAHDDVDDDISAITKGTLTANKSPAFSHQLRQLSNVSESVAKTLKRGFSTASLKSFSSAAPVKGLTRTVSSGIEKVQSATALMKEKYEEKEEVKKEFKVQQAVQKERQLRLENHEVNVEDAILHISGWNESDIPRLNRKWFICAFPLLAGEGPEKVMRKNKFTETNFYQNVLSKNSETYEEENEHLEYEMANNRFPGEAVRSCDLAPFTREAFEKLNFNIHLTDYLRYTRVHLVIYIQTGEEGGDDANAVRTDALPRDTSVPTIRDLVIDKHDMPAYFLPAFHGTVVLNQGKAFPPAGGRLNLNLTPIPNQAIYLSRAQAKRLALMKGLRIAATLSPVAVPTATFLNSLLCKQTPPPTYPSEVLDAISFEKTELDLKEFYGAALCMVRFKERNLVSTRHRGVPHGVLEFSGDGEVVGKAVEHQDCMGTITSMIAGFEHLLCCGSTGCVSVYVQDVKEVDEEYSMAPSSYTNQTSPTEVVRLLTCVRTLADLHKAPVVSCTAVHRAGMDIFFTLDKNDNIGVIVMERGICLRSYLNESFVTYHVTSFVASLDRLYLGLSSGIVVTINLTEIMNGNVLAARNLQDHILGRDVVFSKDAGISTMTIMSQHDFFGMHNEDVSHSDLVDVPDIIKKSTSQSHMGKGNESDNSNSDDENGGWSKGKNKTALRGLKRNKLQGYTHGSRGDDTQTTGEIAINPKCFKLPNPALEGHIILVAGGDKDPRIKVLLPLNKRKEKEKENIDDPDIGFGFREIYVLPGHSKATTQMVTDAAGRFIITASQGSRQMCIWNALTENCEITHDNVNTAFIGLANNALFMCSFKAPFLTIWQPPPKEDPKKRYRKKVAMEDGRYRYEEMAEETPSIDGRPEIGFVRGNVWCMNTIQGGLRCPNRSLAETTFFLGGNGRGRDIVDFWKRYFDRGVKTISKLAPPPPPLKGRKKFKHLNPKGAMAKGLRSKIKLQRRLESQASFISDTPFEEPGDRSFPESPYSEVGDQSKTQSTTQIFNQADDHANFNSYYGCYYDNEGNPYNYDENGKMYYYYGKNDFATDTLVKQMSGYDMGMSASEYDRQPSHEGFEGHMSANSFDDQHSFDDYHRQQSMNSFEGQQYNRQLTTLSFDGQPSTDDYNNQLPIVDNPVDERSASFGEGNNGFGSATGSQDMSPPAQSLVFFDESYRTSSRYEEGFNDDSYDENFSANNGLEFNQPYKSFSPVNTTAESSFQDLPQVKIKNRENLDDYGFNKNTYLEAERDDEEYYDFRGTSSNSFGHVPGRSPVNESTAFLKKNPLSRRRRHMHMSDSEESDDEKLTSIYKVKRTEIRLRNDMNAALSQLDPNGFGYEDQANRIRIAYGFPNEVVTNRPESVEGGGDVGEGGGMYENVHNEMSNLVPEDSYASGQSRDDVSILSITNERKSMMAKRQKYLARRVLYQIDGDESD